MTERDDLLDMLAEVNPVPDASEIYASGADAQRFYAAVQGKRGVMAHTQQPVATSQPWFNRRGVLVAAAAFAVVLLLGVGGWLLTSSGGEETGPVAAEVPPVEEAPVVAADETTTTATPETTAVPEETTTSTTSTTTTTTTSTTSTTTTTSPPAPAISLLGSPVPAPAGVDAEKSWAMGDGPPLCSDFWDYVGPAAVVRDQVGYSGGDGPFFCLVAFDPLLPVEVTVTAPGMQARTRVLTPEDDFIDGAFAFVWLSRPGDPLGEYELEAFQGDGSATTTFEVIAPEEPGLSVDPIRAQRGATVDVYLFGHEPDSEATIDIYHQPQHSVDATYVNSATVTIDAAGWGHLRIDTTTADPIGVYQFITEQDDWVWVVPPYLDNLLELSA